MHSELAYESYLYHGWQVAQFDVNGKYYIAMHFV